MLYGTGIGNTCWMGHVLRHDGLLDDIVEGRMNGKLARGRRRLYTLHDVIKIDGYSAFKQATGDRKGWR